VTREGLFSLCYGPANAEAAHEDRGVRRSWSEAASVTCHLLATASRIGTGTMQHMCCRDRERGASASRLRECPGARVLVAPMAFRPL